MMCGGLSQYRYQKLYDEKAIEFIKKHSMDDTSRTEEDFQLSENIASKAQTGNRSVKET